MKNFLRSVCPECIHTLYAKTKFWLRFHLNPKGLVSEMFRGLMGYEMDWDNPQDLNEKINWMKFNYDTSEWTRLADKYLVREYVRERIGEKALPQLYGVYKTADEIDFDNFPNKFVLKTNQGCGTVLLVKDKAQLNVEAVRRKLNVWVKQRFGYETVEPHYLKIQPVIIAEEFLENEIQQSTSLVDYKVFCLSGKAYCIMVCTNRVIGEYADFAFYDMNWKLITDMPAGAHSKDKSFIVEKPACFGVLQEYAERLAKGHPQVRVDFYIVNNNVYFGEMTFTSQGGFMDYIAKKYTLEMGKLVKL